MNSSELSIEQLEKQIRDMDKEIQESDKSLAEAYSTKDKELIKGLTASIQSRKNYHDELKAILKLLKDTKQPELPPKKISSAKKDYLESAIDISPETLAKIAKIEKLSDKEIPSVESSPKAYLKPLARQLSIGEISAIEAVSERLPWPNSGDCEQKLIPYNLLHPDTEPKFYTKETGAGGDCLFYALNAALSQYIENPIPRNDALNLILAQLAEASNGRTPVGCNKEKGPSKTSTERAMVLRRLIAKSLNMETIKSNLIHEWNIHWAEYSDIEKQWRSAASAKDQEVPSIEEYAIIFYITKLGLTRDEAYEVVFNEDIKDIRRDFDEQLMHTIKIMSREGRWGSEKDIDLLSKLAQINILIIDAKNNENNYINYYNPTDPRNRGDGELIIISNLSNIHYQLGGIETARGIIKSSFGGRQNLIPESLRRFISIKKSRSGGERHRIFKQTHIKRKKQRNSKFSTHKNKKRNIKKNRLTKNYKKKSKKYTKRLKK